MGPPEIGLVFKGQHQSQRRDFLRQREGFVAEKISTDRRELGGFVMMVMSKGPEAAPRPK